MIPPMCRTILVLALSAIVLLSQDPAASRPAAAPPQDVEPSNVKRMVESCKNCHPDVFAEWSASRHKSSWDNPTFQASLADQPDKGESCARCHASRNVLDAGPGALPKARRNGREFGINCVTCHMKDNRYAGPVDSPGHGGVKATADYRETKFCGTCHGQPEARKEHDQVTSFAANPTKVAGDTCQSCHMPTEKRKMVQSERIRDEFTSGVVECRKHTFRGAYVGDMVKESADVKAALDGANLTIDLTPNAGHSIPAASDRRVVLTVEQFDAGGKSLGKDEKDFEFLRGDALKPGQDTRVTFAAKPGMASAKALLVQVMTKAPGRPEPVVQEIGDAEVKR